MYLFTWGVLGVLTKAFSMITLKYIDTHERIVRIVTHTSAEVNIEFGDSDQDLRRGRMATVSTVWKQRHLQTPVEAEALYCTSSEEGFTDRNR